LVVGRWQLRLKLSWHSRSAGVSPSLGRHARKSLVIDGWLLNVVLAAIAFERPAFSACP